MRKRVQLEKTKSKSKFITLASARWTLFDQPYLLEGEDAATYEELLGGIRAAVKPVDIIYEMFIADVVSLEWEVLRRRRLKTSLVRAHGLTRLAEILQENLPEDQAEDSAQTLARECAQNEPDAVDKVNKILDGIGRHLDYILEA